MLCITALWLSTLTSPAAAPEACGDDCDDKAMAATAVSDGADAAADPSLEASTEAGIEAGIEADIDTILRDSSKAYLQARARLEANPAAAAPALVARLQAVPAPGPSERRRLLAVLAEMKRPADLELFAGELRRAVVNADARADPMEVAGPWRNLLVAQGSSAATALQRLVGDKALPDGLRAALLADLVEVRNADDVGDLVILVGRGDDDLRGALTRALVARARVDAAARASIIDATQQALDAALSATPDEKEAARLPAMVGFRARLGGSDADTEALAARLGDLAEQEDTLFAVRVAALRGLGALPPATAAPRLRSVATTQLAQERRETQRGEVLGWLALTALPDETASELTATLRLRDADAPRLATLGYRFAPTNAAATWLPVALENPWPQVRQAAMDRVEGPCEADVVSHLSTRGRPTDEGGDTDRAAGRAAIAGLGRCGGAKATRALTGIMSNARGDMELRAEAARQLVKRGGPQGAEAVAKQLGSHPDPAFARRLAAALRHAPASTPKVDAALCSTLEVPGPVARAAADSLRTLHPGSANPCAPAS